LTVLGQETTFLFIFNLQVWGQTDFFKFILFSKNALNWSSVSEDFYIVTKDLQTFYTSKQDIRSCDTEDWSNDVENSALHPRNKFTLYSNRKQ